MPPPAAGTERRARGTEEMEGERCVAWLEISGDDPREERDRQREREREREGGGERGPERVHNIDRVPLGRVELASAIGSYQTPRRLVDTGALIAAPVFILPAKLIIVVSGSE
jgi:hypothetical protein